MERLGTVRRGTAGKARSFGKGKARSVKAGSAGIGKSCSGKDRQAGLGDVRPG